MLVAEKAKDMQEIIVFYLSTTQLGIGAQCKIAGRSPFEQDRLFQSGLVLKLRRYGLGILSLHCHERTIEQDHACMQLAYCEICKSAFSHARRAKSQGSPKV